SWSRPSRARPRLVCSLANRRGLEPFARNLAIGSDTVHARNDFVDINSVHFDPDVIGFLAKVEGGKLSLSLLSGVPLGDRDRASACQVTCRRVAAKARQAFELRDHIFLDKVHDLSGLSWVDAQHLHANVHRTLPRSTRSSDTPHSQVYSYFK